jgi:ribosomal protein S18 acetylase RimI-like enzyme
MIRWRQQRDDKVIVELVRTLLVPISSWQRPKDRRLSSEISRRLRRGATLVAAPTRRGSPIAFLHMEFHHPILLIDLLAVDPKHQSKHFGTELMLQAEQYGRTRGLMVSHVFVDEDNAHAFGFYRRLGYYPLRLIPSLKVIELAKDLSRLGD